MKNKQQVVVNADYKFFNFRPVYQLYTWIHIAVELGAPSIQALIPLYVQHVHLYIRFGRVRFKFLQIISSIFLLFFFCFNFSHIFFSHIFQINKKSSFISFFFAALCPACSKENLCRRRTFADIAQAICKCVKSRCF